MCAWYSGNSLKNHFSDTCRQAFICRFTDLFVSAAKMLGVKRQRIFTDLPVTCYVLACQSTPYEQHKKAASLKTHRHTNAHKLRIYTPTQRRAKYTSGSITSPPLNWAVAEFHHHPRHSEPREIFLQRKFPFDNWSVYWNLHMPTWWFCAAACCDGNDNTDYGLETANLMQCDCLNAFTLKISLFHATVKLCERTVLVLYAVKERGSAVI